MTVRDLQRGDRVYAYCRDSGGAGQDRSVAEQRSEIIRYCEAHGLIIVGWFIDEARPSGDYARRGDFRDLISACLQQPAPVEGVITSSGTRWGRDEYDSAAYRIELRRNGVQVVAVNGPQQVGAWAMAIETLLDTSARIQLDQMSYEVRKGLRANVAEHGLAPGGRPPVGYRAIPVPTGQRRDGKERFAARWEPDPEKGPRVTRAFHLLDDGASYAHVHAQTQLLNAPSSYRCMFRNRTYLGILKLGDEEFPGKIEPLIDQETFDRVQARIKTRTEQASQARRMNSPYLLTGLARCGLCDALLDGATDRRPEKRGQRAWRGYRCRTPGCTLGRVSAAAVDRTTVGVVLDTVLTPDALAEMFKQLRVELAGDRLDADLGRLEAEISTARRRMNRLLDQIEEGAGGAATNERLRQRERELVELEAQRADLLRRRELADSLVDEALIGQVVAEMRASVTDDDVPVARHALAQFVSAVRVWDDRVEVMWQADGLAAVVQGYGCMPPKGFAMLPCRDRKTVLTPLSVFATMLA
jgi:DNA invertase Pin-like site-specific DNA recombinase